MEQVSPILFSIQDVDTCSEHDFIHVWTCLSQEKTKMQNDPGLAEEDLKQLEVPVPRKSSSTLVFSPLQKRLAVDLISFLHLG